MKKILIASLLMGSVVFANEGQDVVFKGCSDVMKNRSTQESYYVLGFIHGTNWLGYDVLNKMGKPTTVGLDYQDAKNICKYTPQKRYEIEKSELPSTAYLSVIIRGYYVVINGYTWEEIQERVKLIQKKLGLLSEKKKY